MLCWAVLTSQSSAEHQLQTPPQWDFGAESKRRLSWAGGHVTVLLTGSRSTFSWVWGAWWILWCLTRAVLTWQPPLCAGEVPVLCKGQDQRVSESLGPTWMNRRGK